MAEERQGAVTMRGNPMTLVGPGIKPGTESAGLYGRREGTRSGDAQSIQGQGQNHLDDSVGRHAGLRCRDAALQRGSREAAGTWWY